MQVRKRSQGSGRWSARRRRRLLRLMSRNSRLLRLIVRQSWLRMMSFRAYPCSADMLWPMNRRLDAVRLAHLCAPDLADVADALRALMLSMFTGSCMWSSAPERRATQHCICATTACSIAISTQCTEMQRDVGIRVLYSETSDMRSIR